MVEWMVSHSDVVKHPRWNGKNLDQVLRSYGMDTRFGYQDDGRHLIECKFREEVDEFDYFHKSIFTGEICKGPRYIGVARQDGPWKRFVDRYLELPLI